MARFFRRSSGLVIWPSNGNSAMYHTYYTLNFTNLSGHACTLRGSPGVSAVSLSGRQLGRSASGNYSGHVREVRLANGATAQALLSIDALGIIPSIPTPCSHPVTAAGLRVYPPGQFSSKVIPFPLGACTNRAVYMSVGVVTKS